MNSGNDQLVIKAHNGDDAGIGGGREAYYSDVFEWPTTEPIQETDRNKLLTTGAEQ